jgi:alkyl sulfatase BDS1-like metallo-beta-lactamase superfamily hydrolase
MKRARWLAMVVGAAVCSAGAAASDPVTPATKAAQAAAQRAAPLADVRDEDFARRGYIGTLADPVIRSADGRTVWDPAAFDFLKGPAPETVNPSLWRHAGLMALSGLFKVSDRIWQVRGFDLANITFVKGATGWIVIDTLGSVETAQAALRLVNDSVAKLPVVAVIYTHPHVDHFGGAAGLISAEDARSGKVQVIAPTGFAAAAIGENVIAGLAMQRRAIFQFGIALPKSATGTVNSGIGAGIATGTNSLILPNRDIGEDGELLTVDGVKLRFQLTHGTEAPVELNIDFPDWHIIDMAENANATQHNILTPRGAVVRDARAWAAGLTAALDRFGDSDILITSHGWPRFGRDVIVDYLGKQRDYYAFVHDQTVRLMNQGFTGDEIAATLKLPPALAKEWFDRPYYGSLSFNARAVYQFYMGWYDANPVHLAPLPPAEAGRRYVAAMGGAAKVRALAQTAYDAGDYGWAAELLNRAVFADGTDIAARALLARCYEQLGYQSENALWRNMYLTGAAELVDGPPKGGPTPARTLVSALSTPEIFDLLAVRLRGDAVGDTMLKLAFVFPDRNENTYVTVANGVLVHRPIAAPGPVDATLTVKRSDFLASIMGGAPLLPKLASGEAKITGDATAFQRFVSLMAPSVGNFPIVTPR